MRWNRRSSGLRDHRRHRRRDGRQRNLLGPVGWDNIGTGVSRCLALAGLRNHLIAKLLRLRLQVIELLCQHSALLAVASHLFLLLQQSCLFFGPGCRILLLLQPLLLHPLLFHPFQLPLVPQLLLLLHPLLFHPFLLPLLLLTQPLLLHHEVSTSLLLKAHGLLHGATDAQKRSRSSWPRHASLLLHLRQHSLLLHLKLLLLFGQEVHACLLLLDQEACLLLLHDVLLLLKPHVCHVRCCWSRKDRHAWHHRSLLPCSLVHLFCKQPLLPHQILRRRPRRLRLCRGHPSWRWVVRLLWSEGRFLWHGWWDRRRERRFGWERGLHGCSPHLGRRHLPFHMVACRGRLL